MELISRDCWMRKGRVGNSDPGRTRQQGPLAGSREGGWNGSKCVSSICRDFARKRGRNAKEASSVNRLVLTGRTLGLAGEVLHCLGREIGYGPYQLVITHVEGKVCLMRDKPEGALRFGGAPGDEDSIEDGLRCYAKEIVVGIVNLIELWHSAVKAGAAGTIEAGSGAVKVFSEASGHGDPAKLELSLRVFLFQADTGAVGRARIDGDLNEFLESGVRVLRQAFLQPAEGGGFTTGLSLPLRTCPEFMGVEQILDSHAGTVHPDLCGPFHFRSLIVFWGNERARVRSEIGPRANDERAHFVRNSLC